MSEQAFTIALAGNPNSGKTTIFNAITGIRQKVGNWPGVTVEKKEGFVKKKKLRAQNRRFARYIQPDPIFH